MSAQIPRKLGLYIGIVTLAGVVIMRGSVGNLDVVTLLRDAEFWMLAAAIVAGEFIHIRIPHGRESVTVTIADPFTLALLFQFGLAPAIIAKTIASLVDDRFGRHAEWWKSLFNIGQLTLSLAIGHWVITGIGRVASIDSGLSLGNILITLAASSVYFLVNMTLVQMAIVLATGTSPIRYVKSQMKARVISQAALLGFTPVVIAALEQSQWLFPLLLIPVIVVYQSGTMMQRHVVLADQLREFYEATRTSHRSVEIKDSVRELLERVVAMFGASQASITLFASEKDENALLTRLDVDRSAFSYMESTDLDPTKGVWARAAAEDKAILIAAPIANPRLEEHFTSLGVRDAMVAPMRSDERVIGIIEVANRQGKNETFTGEDLKLFETLANHASVSLENARLIGELEESLVHLTEMNQLKDDFVASVSHELRTPLTSIRGYVKTLLRSDAHFAPNETHAFLETIDRQSQRLQRLIEDLLVVSRIESASVDDEIVHEFSLRKLIEEVVDELRAKLEGRTVTVALDVIPSISTDPGKVYQILCNLLDNAVKYSPSGTPIEIEGHLHGAGVAITVRDSGPGIDAKSHEKIFDRFFQVDQSATRSVGGAGLGLYICRKLAEALGGRLWLESSGEAGSEFSLWIPMTTGVRPAPSPAGEIARLTHLT